jgi:hypothetical protein
MRSVWLPVAAALAAGVVAVVFWGDGIGGKAPLRAARLDPVGRLRMTASGPAHAWPVTRGGLDSHASEETAFRTGTWIVDLRTALVSGELAVASQAIGQVLALIEGLEFAEPAELVSHADQAEARLDSLQVLPAPQLTLGKWTEAGRLAVARADLGFLDKAFAEPFPAGIEEPLSELPETARALGAVRTRLESGDVAPQLEALQKELDLLAAIQGAH